jgi:hypothetical protein
MKKYIGSAILLFGLAVYGYCASASRHMPHPGQFNSEAVYITTKTNVKTVAAASVSGTIGGCVVSTFPCFLYGMQINDVGSSDARLEIFDGRIATNAAGVKALFDINLSTMLPTFIWNVQASSGLMWNNQGKLIADVTLIYREKARPR